MPLAETAKAESRKTRVEERIWWLVQRGRAPVGSIVPTWSIISTSTEATIRDEGNRMKDTQGRWEQGSVSFPGAASMRREGMRYLESLMPV